MWLCCKMPDRINTAEAAKRLGRSVSRVKQLIDDGRLPAVRAVSGNGWEIDPADLELPAVKNRAPGYPKGRPRKKSQKNS